jgi:hypothetical protein
VSLEMAPMRDQSPLYLQAPKATRCKAGAGNAMAKTRHCASKLAHPASTKPRAKSATPDRSRTLLESNELPPPARSSSSSAGFFARHGRRRPRAAGRGASGGGTGATVLAPACHRSMPFGCAVRTEPRLAFIFLSRPHVC